MDIQVALELAKQDICPHVLRKSQTSVLVTHQVKEISVGQRTIDHAAVIDRPMRPGIHACQHGGGPGRCEIASSVMPVIDGGTAGELLEAGSRAARVSVQGQVPGGHGIEHEDQDIRLAVYP